VNYLLAAYSCAGCEVSGRVAEDTPGEALCWCCGRPAVITAHVSPVPLKFGAALAAARNHP
jgi:hypothetical protein